MERGGGRQGCFFLKIGSFVNTTLARTRLPCVPTQFPVLAMKFVLVSVYKAILISLYKS